VAIATAMHCNLRPQDAAPVLICCNYDDVMVQVGHTFYSRVISVLLLIRYVTL